MDKPPLQNHRAESKGLIHQKSFVLYNIYYIQLTLVISTPVISNNRLS